MSKFNKIKDFYSNNQLMPSITALILMLIAQIICTLSMGGSLTVSWMNILRNNVYQGIIALGMAFVIISGGIDISVGSMLCALGAITLYLVNPNGGVLSSLGITGAPCYILTIIIVLACGCILGAINGLIISYGKIPAFIVTLGTMKIFRSVTQQLTKTFTAEVPDGFKQITSKKIGGEVLLPILFWVLLAVILEIVFSKTVFGRQVVSIGSNEKASIYAGINVKKVKLLIYGLVGFCCAISSIIYISRIGSMDFANAGSGYEMDSIAAVVVGGISMNGGKGRVIGAFIGMLIIGLMNNILNVVGVPTFLCDAFKGIIIIVAVLVQRKK